MGKSTLIRHLGEQRYEHLVEINLATNTAGREALAGARDVHDLVRRISLFSSGPMPQHATLVFIDEIQELPNIMTMAKALVEDGRFDYAFSGSMLGTEEYALQRGIVFSRLNIERSEKVVYSPWYAVPFLKEFLQLGTKRADGPFVISLPKA